jgi:glycosyltransferase involved in cell wall biosynthesis
MVPRGSGPHLMNGPSGISAVIISCEDGEVIEACLASVAGWVDEIVVVDMGSRDETHSIAVRYGALIFDHERLPFADPARNFAMSKATRPWVLLLDPDERVLPSLATRLRELVIEDVWDVVDIPFIQIVFGRRLTAPGGQDGPHPRLLRRIHATWPSEVHAHPAFEGLRRLDLSAEPGWRQEELAIVHDTWRSPHQVFDKFARYIAKDAERRLARGETFSFSSLVRGVAQVFEVRLIRGRSWEDGMAGLLHTSLFAVMELGAQAEMWQQQGHPPGPDAAVRRWGRCTVPLRYLGSAARQVRKVSRRLQRIRARRGRD